MIKLFRNIRQNLLAEDERNEVLQSQNQDTVLVERTASRMGRYLKYAIGEIILVVIGILIALQINNWNESRKERFLENKILQTINEDLKTDIINMKSMITHDSIIRESNVQLIEILKDSLSNYDNSFGKLFGAINRYDIFSPQKMGYESLKSKGLELIKNDSLRSKIIYLYDFQYALAAETMDLKKQLYLDSNPIFNKEFDTNLSDSKTISSFAFVKVPYNFKALNQNREFMGNLTHLTEEQHNFITHDKSILKKMVSTKRLIEKELKQ